MSMFSDFSTTMIGLLTTIAFGFWMSRLGRPYNGILFNIHKLTALATVILAGMQVYPVLTGLQTEFMILSLLVMAVLGVIALFVSGAFLSIGKLNYGVVKAGHNIALGVAVLCCGLVIYLLNTRL